MLKSILTAQAGAKCAPRGLSSSSRLTSSPSTSSCSTSSPCTSSSAKSSSSSPPQHHYLPPLDIIILNIIILQAFWDARLSLINCLHTAHQVRPFGTATATERIWFSKLTTSKTKQFCETCFNNGKLSAELPASYQCVLHFFHFTHLKYCACHQKGMPRHTMCYTCHAKSS